MLHLCVFSFVCMVKLIPALPAKTPPSAVIGEQLAYPAIKASRRPLDNLLAELTNGSYPKIKNLGSLSNRKRPYAHNMHIDRRSNKRSNTQFIANDADETFSDSTLKSKIRRRINLTAMKKID